MGERIVDRVEGDRERDDLAERGGDGGRAGGNCEPRPCLLRGGATAEHHVVSRVPESLRESDAEPARADDPDSHAAAYVT